MSEEDPNPTTGRREFIASGARWVAIGGMATLAAAQAYKAQRLAGDPNCIRLNTCADCIEFSSGCQLLKAQAFREAQAPKNGSDRS